MPCTLGSLRALNCCLITGYVAIPEPEDGITQLLSLCQLHWVAVAAYAGYKALNSPILSSILKSVDYLNDSKNAARIHRHNGLSTGAVCMGPYASSINMVGDLRQGVKFFHIAENANHL